MGHEDEFVRCNLSSEQEDQRQLVLSTLCLRIRSITGESKYQEYYKYKPSNEIQTMMSVLFERPEEPWEELSADLSNEIQAMIRVLFEKADENEAPCKGLSADLSNGYFCGLDLISAQFQGAILRGAQFQKAVLLGARCHGADIGNAKFHETDLKETSFQEASLEGAEFHGADLEFAELQGAYLADTKFQGAHLGFTCFQGAYLENAQFQGAYLECVQFQGAYLENAQFQRAYLADVKFQGANLQDTQFQGAKLRRAQFQGCVSGETTQWKGNFGEQIRQHVGKTAELSKVTFAGGIQQEDLDKMVRKLEHIILDEFRSVIAEHLDENIELSPAIFYGGIQQEDLDRMVRKLEHLDKEIIMDFKYISKRLDKFRNTMAEHVGKLGRRGTEGIPEEFRGEVGLDSYTKEDAEQWIASYEEAIRIATSPDYDYY